jgi:hypothetical protein
MKKLITMIFAAGCFALGAYADVSYSFNGGMMTITAPSTLAGKGIRIVWDSEDRGVEPAAWANVANVVDAVPAAGGTYTIDLESLGIANGQPCRIVTSTRYRLLDKLQMTSTQTYINTGIKGHDVYGLRFGFYPTGKSGTGGTDFYSAVNCGKDNGTSTIANRGGFLVCVAKDKELHRFRFLWRGKSYDKGDNRVNIDGLNEYAFTNRVCTLNGVIQQSDLAAGAISTNNHNVFLGKCSYTTYSLYGWWSHVSFDDEDGNRILDYIPVQRASDGKVGFWNRIGDGSFVTSSGTGNFTAGTFTNAYIDVDVDATQTFSPNRIIETSLDGATLTVVVPAGLGGEQLLVLWDDEDMGADISAWAHTNVIEEAIADNGGTYTVKLTSYGVKDDNFVRVAAANRYKTLDMLQMTSNLCYVDTDVKDSDVYGVRFGFYPVSSGNGSSHWSYCIGSSEKGFSVGENGSSISTCVTCYRGDKFSGAARPTVSTERINEYAYTNKVATLDGTVFKSGLEAGAVGTTGNNMYLGTAYVVKTSGYTGGTRYLRGWWSHVSFDDADGNRILDYIPVQRVSDGKVGFYDRATLSFVTSSGKDSFSAGIVTNDTPVTAVNAVCSALRVRYPGLIISVK